VALGDTTILKVGGLQRKDATQTVEMRPGDVWVMGGTSRLRFHAVSRIVPNTNPGLDMKPGRLSLSIRRSRGES
jgi:alkylated DNA repair protein (DNA oxidative demethylase)